MTAARRRDATQLILVDLVYTAHSPETQGGHCSQVIRSRLGEGDLGLCVGVLALTLHCDAPHLNALSDACLECASRHAAPLRALAAARGVDAAAALAECAALAAAAAASDAAAAEYGHAPQITRARTPPPSPTPTDCSAAATAERPSNGGSSSSDAMGFSSGEMNVESSSDIESLASPLMQPSPSHAAVTVTTSPFHLPTSEDSPPPSPMLLD